MSDDALHDLNVLLLSKARRQLACNQARDSLPKFIHLMMPDEEFPDDPEKSVYQFAPHCKLLCELVTKVEEGSRMRVAVSIPPQHGKTIHLSTYGPAWILGRNPSAQIIVATYNEKRAADLGEDFRRTINSPVYKNIFKDVELEYGSQSKLDMTTTKRGKIAFVGTGGTVTGRTAGFFIIDDPTKDDEELQSDIARDKLWKWFYSVAYSRGSKRTRIIVLHTRWHSDDLIGRLCDPKHPDHKRLYERNSKDWEYLNISGVIRDKGLADALGIKLERQTDPGLIEAFGTEPVAALWPEEKDLPFFAQWKWGEPRTFSALVMGEPAIEDGAFFRAEHLLEYDFCDLPLNLRKYGASDHAVTEDERNDPNVLGCVGVDDNDHLWVMPDITWEHMATDEVVERFLYHFKTHNPQLWWMENELISKSFGPFLHKRMVETKTFVTIDPVTPAKDKKKRAQAIQGRMSMRMVHFPRFAPWWQRARSELLQFPYGAHDDFVDWLAHIGMGLMKEMKPAAFAAKSNNLVVVGSPAWILREAFKRGRDGPRVANSKGW